MYHYVEDKVFLSDIRKLCGEIMQDFCHILATEYGISSSFYMVGSGARNLILQNNSRPVDLDYNLEIDSCPDFNNCRDIKEKAILAFNAALKGHGWSNCQDSKSCMTTEHRHFTKGNPTEFSMDVCIISADNRGQCHRLIHEKASVYALGHYYWNIAPNSANLRKKVKYIKDQGNWLAVREEYLEIKNMYLTRNAAATHPSFICYIEAVNHVYDAMR